MRKYGSKMPLTTCNSVKVNQGGMEFEEIKIYPEEFSENVAVKITKYIS